MILGGNRCTAGHQNEISPASLSTAGIEATGWAKCNAREATNSVLLLHGLGTCETATTHIHKIALSLLRKERASERKWRARERRDGEEWRTSAALLDQAQS